MRTRNPKARRDGLLLEELPSELLVYDQKTHKAHCLNPSAASVFRLADGTLSIAEISRGTSERLQAPFDDDLAWMALEELDKNGLLETALPLSPERQARRQVIGAAAAVALAPLVMVMTAPTPAYAASGPIGSTAPVGPFASTGGL